MKFCRDCIYRAGDQCHHEKARIYHLVTGEEFLSTALSMRTGAGRCGWDAVLFEPVPGLEQESIPNPPF